MMIELLRIHALIRAVLALLVVGRILTSLTHADPAVHYAPTETLSGSMLR
jgi:hypothetical protein